MPKTANREHGFGSFRLELPKLKNQKQHTMEKRWQINSLIFILCAVSLLLNSCAVNPVTGKRELMLMSKQQEIALGVQSDPQIVASYGQYKDEQMQQFIDAKGNLMARVSHQPNLDYEFKVLDSPVVNAFALPGGFVYFTRGIMAHFNNEAQFAGVLGHEIGHITARHSANQYSKQMLAQVGLIAGVIASPEFAQYANIANQGLGLLFLKFGRDDESQSDQLGVEYSTKIGYDASEMAGFFQTLKRLTNQSGGGSLPTFLSTHPDPANRYEHVNELAQKWKKRTNRRDYEVGRESYLRMIDGMVYGEDPRQGYVENNIFYHPELKFQFPIPRNWQFVNAPTMVQMAPESGNAVLAFMLSPENEMNAAVQTFREQYSSIEITQQRDDRINGMNARMLRGRQVDQQSQQVIEVLVYLIEYGDNIYKWIGMAQQQAYNTYDGVFMRSIEGFDRLTDAAKLNREPERLDIYELPQSTSLRNALQRAGIPGSRLEEFAILNGMQLTDQLSRGTLIKVIE